MSLITGVYPMRLDARRKRAQVRNFTHLIMVFSLLFTALSPLFDPALAYQYSTASAGVYAAALPGSGEADDLPWRAPYLPGHTPQTLEKVAADFTPNTDSVQMAKRENEQTAQVNRVFSRIPNLSGQMSVLPAQTTAAPRLPNGQTLGAETLPTWFASSPAMPTGAGMAIGAFSGLMAPGDAQCTPADSLVVQLSLPPTTVSRGNIVGDVYTATVTNNGTISTTDVNLLVDPNVGFFYKTGSANVISNLAPAPALSAPGTDTVADAAFTLRVTGSTTATRALQPGETMQFRFRLATTADAQSGQSLAVTVQSGDPTVAACKTRLENVQTVRGNLVVLKSPSVQEAGFGDTVTWTVTLRNNGLGMVYDGLLADVPGSGLAGLSVSPALTPVDLQPEQNKTYTVTAQIAACTDLTNQARADWTIGNQDGTATSASPVTDNADIIFNLEDPNLQIEIEPMPDVTYCGSLNTSLTVTVTNIGGAARNLRLNLAAQNVTVGTPSGNWTRSGNTLSYTGGAPLPTGTLRGGERVTFEVPISTGDLCTQATAAVEFTPVYVDACQLLEITGDPVAITNPLPEDAPTLVVTKTAPSELLVVGQPFTYTIHVSGENEQNISGGIAVTDLVTTALTINSISASRGATTQTGNTVQWTIPTTGTGAFAEVLLIQGVLPATAACPVETTISNSVQARASVCPECELTDEDTFTSYIVDYVAPGINQFSKTTSSVELCSVEQNQMITADLQVRSGITWTSTIYTDTLGEGQLTEPLTVISGSVNVLIDGIDRTDDVMITHGPPLVVDFSPISDTLGAAFTQNTHITITYAVTNGGTISGDLASNEVFLFSEFNLNGPLMACDGSTTGTLGALVTLERGNLDLSIMPGVLNACRENMITLNVTGASVDQVTDGIQVVFTPGPSDIITPTFPSLGGGLVGQPVTVTRSNGMNPGSVVTFTFAPSFDLDADGTITFPLFRPCGAEGVLDGQLHYLDQCRTPRNATTVVTPTVRAANLTLFTTPNRVTVHERNANWRFYVSNGGDLGASTTYVTNTLPAYHHFSTYSVTSTFASPALLSAITAVTGTAASGREIVTFTIPATPGLAAGDRLQFDVESEFQQCTPAAFVDIALFSNCSSISDSCGGRATGMVEFIPGATSLLSSNDQTANLPLCEVGQVKLVVKNTSPRSQEFDLTITDRITNGTFIGANVPHVTVTNSLGQVVVGATSGTPLANIPFAPTSVASNGANSVFTWTVSGFITGTAQYDVLKVRDPSDQILVIYSVKTGCTGEETKVQASGQTKDVCNVPLNFLEDSESFTVNKPELVVTKRGRNLTTGTALAVETFASAGDIVVWQIDVENIGLQQVTNLFVNDPVPANYTITAINHPAGYGTNTANAAEWGDQSGAGGMTLAVGATQSFLITGTVGGGAMCALEDDNIATVAYGCSTTDICLAAPIEARAILRTRPTLGAATAAGNLSSCGGLMTLEVNSNGPSATNVTVTDTLPAGLVYESLVSITPITASNALTIATVPVDGDAVPTFEFSSLPSNQAGATPIKTIITYRVRNANSNINNACVAIPTSVNNRLDVAYDDTCTLSGPYTTTHTSALNVGQPNLNINQTPLQQTRDVGQTITWTLRVTNTGNAIAPNISISDVVPNGFANLVATNGSGGQQTTTASLVGNTITWSPPFTLAANGVWSAQVTAQVNSSGQHTSTVQATGHCGAGCIYASDRATSYVSLLQTFVKGPQIQTGTIGALAVFTVSNILPTTGGNLYNNIRLTDTLPTGLGYVAARLVYTAPVNGVPTTVVRAAPDSFPAANSTGNLIWNLGDLTGTVQLNAVITTVIQSLASNYAGVRRTNSIALGYVDNGLTYRYIDTAHVDVIEPLLHLGKEYVTSHACSAKLWQDNFNDGDAAGWTPSGGAWNVTNSTYQAATGASRRSLAGNITWTDYSYSALAFTTDPDGGDLGLILRAQDSTHYYRFRWTRNAAGTSGSYLLERVDGGTVTALGATAGSFYALNQWYHIEVRVEGNRFRVYIDGALALDRTDSTPIWTSGGVGFYADNQSNVFFDDALVTRLDDEGCFVGANDLVTYTLTISNQGRAIGQELVITDVIPTGMSYVTSSLTGNDPTASVTAAPSGGATGALVWRINHLTPTVPFDAANHTALNLNVVLRVAPEIGAQTILSSQAMLSYDSQTDTGPVGVQRAYSGGSHSTAVQTVAPTLLKATAPLTLTIGEAFRYTITLPSQPITATLHHVTVTDQIPANVLIIGAPQMMGGVGGSAALSSGNNITVTFTSVPSATQASVVITGVVRNTLANQQGVQFTNRAQMGWTDHLSSAKPPILSNLVTNSLLEPTLIVRKSVQPASASPGDTVFYEIRVFHAPTSTIPAYNVQIEDLIPAGLQYSFGSWPSSNLPIAVANTGIYTDAMAPVLGAYFPVITPALTAANPLIIRYQAVLASGLAYGSVLTNVVTTTWTSLPTNRYSEDRSGTGGVNDYAKSDLATVALSDVLLDKTGPLTVTAGSIITYLLTVNNLGPFTATNGIVRDVMPFQVTTLAAHFDVPTQLSGACSITPASSGDVVTCAINDLPSNIVARIVITGLVDADTPLGADLTNAAEVSITSADGRPINNEDEVETEVYTAADHEVNKYGPTSTVAGQTVTYTIVLTNHGPSVSRAVDVKDQLPPGITFVSGSSTQGICVSAICQTGDVQPGQRITMVITGTVDSAVTGLRTNRAQVFSATTDPNSTNNVDIWATTISRLTALEIHKVDLSDPVYAGSTYFYEIVVTNTGLSDAANVIITDTLPTHVAFQGSSPECSHNGATTGGAVQCTLGTLAAGESRDYLINVQVNMDVVSGTLGINTVSVTTTTPIDLPSSTLTDNASTRYLQPFGSLTDLQIVKSVSPASVIAGSGRITYTLVVTNNGPAPASAVQVVDAFPRQFSFISAVINKSTTTALCSNDGVCDLGEMNKDESARITLVFDVPSAVSAGSYTNTAHVSSPAAEVNLANNTASIAVAVTRQATFQIRKVAYPNPAVPGQDLTYTIIVTNTGPSDAASVTVTDTLPSAFTQALVLSSQGGCATLPCSLGPLAANHSASVTIVGRVAANATATLNNTARVTSQNPSASTSTTIQTPVAGTADLALVQRATATTTGGGVITYTLTVFNAGPADAQGVRITNTLPAGVSVVNPGGCAQTGNLLVCHAGTVAVGSPVTFTLRVDVDADLPPGTSLENQAVVYATTPDPNLANNSAVADTSILGNADLYISKVQIAPLGAVNAGESVTYRITITNSGPSLARSVDVKDQLPLGLTLQSSLASDGGVCGGAVCQFGTLPTGATRTITVVAGVNSDSLAGVYTNTAAVYSTDETNQANNTATATTTVKTNAALHIAKVDLFDPVAPGGGQLYQLVVRNDGPSAARNVVITDTLPTNVSFSNASPGCLTDVADLRLIVCNVGTLAAGAIQSFLIAVQINDEAPDGAILTNHVFARTSTTTTVASASVTTTVQGFGNNADLGIHKSTALSSVTAGERISYTLLVTNAGPSVATNVQLLELIPAGTTVVTLTASNPDFTGEFCSLGGTCYLGTVLTATTATIQVVLQVNSDFTRATLINSASVAGDQQDPDASNNFSSTSTPVNQRADLSVTKVDLPDPIIVGETLLYQIVVTNSGPSDAQAVIISDILDMATAFAGATPGCTHDGASAGGLVTCTLGGLAAGATADFLLEVRVDPALITNTLLLNHVSVRSTTPDPNPANDLDSETTQANLGALAPVDLAIAKSATPSTVTAGELLTYTLVITNHGEGSASNVQVIDALPLGRVTLISAASSQGLCNAGVGCALGDMAVNATATITLLVRVNADQTTDLLNVARVSASNPDKNAANNQASAATLVVTSAEVGILKTANPTVATPGATLSYQLVITNAGPSTARGVVVSDLLPVELSEVRFATNQGSCNPGGPCALGDLPVGGRVTISVIGTVAADAQTAFTNTAVVSSSTPDSKPANNISNVTTNVQGRADLGLDMVATPTAIGGGTATVTVTVFNVGPSNAHGAMITLTLPLSTSLAGGLLPAGWGYIDNGDNTLTIFANGPILPGTTTNLPFNVNVAPNVEPGTSLEFAAVVTATTADPNPFNNRADADTSIIGFADLVLDKQGPATLVAGERVTYTVIVTNNGPSTAQSVDIKDALPTGIALINASIVRSQSGTLACGGPICQTGDMAAGETVTMTVIGVVAAAVADGTLLSNTAAVFSDTPESNLLNNLATVTATVGTRADIRVTKVDLNDPVAPTQGLLYQIVVFNAGPSDAQAVVVTDTLDANVRFSNASEGCTLNGSEVICTVGTLAAASSQTFLLAVTANDVPSGTLLINNVVAHTATTDPNLSNNTDTVTTTVEQSFGPTADLALAKRTTVTDVVAGTQISYTIAVTNAGPATATNVRLLELIPAGTTVLALTANNPVSAGEFCSLGGACNLGALLPAATALITVVLQVDADFAGATLINRASVAADQPDPNPANNLDETSTPVRSETDLSVSKVDLPDPVIAGETLLYQIVITNSGPSAAQNVVISDTLEPNTYFSGADPSCTHDGSALGGVVTCALNTLPADTTTAILLQVRVAPSLITDTILLNQVTVSSSTPDTNPANNAANASTQAYLGSILPVDLAIAKTATPTTVTAGELVTYTLVVTNYGAGTANNVQVVDALPLGAVTLLDVISSQGLCNTGVVCDLGNLVLNQTATITLVARVHADQTSALLNMARVSASNPDTDANNNQATAIVAITTAADLNIIKTATPITATGGGALSYQIIVRNTGPSDAQHVVVNDLLPIELTGVSFGASQGACSGGSCSLGVIPAGGEATISVVGTVAANASAPFTNTASVSSTTLDPNPTNNQSSVTVAVRGSADLMLDLTSTPTANGGETAVVTATVFNQGPSYAVGAVVTVTLPAAVTFASAALPAGWTAVDNGNGTVTLSASMPITPAVIIGLPLTVNLDPDVEPGVSLEFSATVRAMTYDPNLFNNRDNADTTINARADLLIDKRGPAALLAGKPITYTIVVTNEGPSTAQAVDIKDQLPVGLSLIRATVQRSGSGPALCAGLVCQTGDLILGEIVTVTVVAQAAANLAQGSMITNTAAVFSSSHDPDQSTNIDVQVATVTTLAQLTISKQATPNPAIPGAGLTYQIAVFNAGPSDAQNVVVSDTLPIGFQANSISSDLGLCTALPCTVGTVPAGARVLISVQGQVASSLTTPLVNQATVASTTPLTATNGTSTTITTNVSPRADLRLDIHSTPTANAGETAGVTVTLRNEGPSHAAGTIVTVTVPVGAHFVSANLPASWTTVDQGNGTLIITTSTSFTPGLVINLPLTVALDSTIEPGSSLQFSATVTATTPDPDLTDNTGNSDTSVIGKADLALSKTGPTLVTAGAPVTYTIVVSNQGPSTARFVDVKDALPEGLSLLRAVIVRTGTGAATCAGTVCQAGNMPVGELITITVVGKVAADITSGTRLTNTAVVFANTPDPNPTNNAATWQSRVQTLASLRIRKRDLSDPVTPGQILIYSIDVINSGPSYARDVIVTDRLPTGVTYTGSTGSCVQAPVGTLRCTVAGAPLVGVAPGTTASFLIAVTVDDTVVSGLYLNNTATLASSTPLTDSILADSEETLVQQFLGPPADLVLEKQAYSAAVMASGLVTYTLTITNNGPATATDVKVLDALPTGLTLVRTVASQGLCESGITCFLGTILYTGEPSAVRVTIVARAAAEIRQGVTLTNTALVQGSQPDPIQANNLDAVGIIVGTAADLTIKKTGTPNPAVAGEQLLYTIVVTNAGPADAVGVVITDVLPVGFTKVSLIPSQGVCEATAICQLGNLAVHGKVTINVLGMVAPSITGTITNTVTVASATADPNPNNNQSISVIPVHGRANLAVDVTATPTVLSGETGVITVTVYNHGPSDAQGAVITVTIPPETTYARANLPPGWTASDQGNSIINIRASVPVAPGVPIDLPFIVQVAPGLELGTSYQVSAIVKAATPDDNPFDNRDNADTSVVGKADVQVTKVASINPVEAGATLIYTITVENLGPSFAQDVDIKEFLPVSVTLQTLNTSQGACISNICQLGRISISETVMITVVTVVDPDLPPGTRLVNKAIAFTDSRDPNPANNTDEVIVLVGPIADLRMVKLSNKTMVKPGSEVIYTLVITNFGPSMASNVIVTDTMPNGVIYLQNEPLCEENAPSVVSCYLGDMAVNQSAQFNLFTLIDSTAISGTTPNTAQMMGTHMFDPEPLTNEGTAIVEVVSLPTASEIIRFAPISSQRSITIEWTTVLEIDLQGFHLLRSTSDNPGQAVRVTTELIEGQGTRGGNYSFVDPDVVAGVGYTYWLQEIALDGTVYLNGPIHVVFGKIDGPAVIFLPIVQQN